MEWKDLFAAFALFMVLEGLLPFLAPRGWKQGMELVTKLTDSQLRKIGLVVMLIGLVLLAVVRG